MSRTAASIPVKTARDTMLCPMLSSSSAEIAATVSEHLFKALKGPVRRRAAPRIPISYAPPLEDVVRVSEAQIIETVTEMMAI